MTKLIERTWIGFSFLIGKVWEREKQESQREKQESQREKQESTRFLCKGKKSHCTNLLVQLLCICWKNIWLNANRWSSIKNTHLLVWGSVSVRLTSLLMLKEHLVKCKEVKQVVIDKEYTLTLYGDVSLYGWPLCLCWKNNSFIWLVICKTEVSRTQILLLMK